MRPPGGPERVFLLRRQASLFPLRGKGVRLPIAPGYSALVLVLAPSSLGSVCGPVRTLCLEDVPSVSDPPFRGGEGEHFLHI